MSRYTQDDDENIISQQDINPMAVSIIIGRPQDARPTGWYNKKNKW